MPPKNLLKKFLDKEFGQDTKYTFFCKKFFREGCCHTTLSEVDFCNVTNIMFVSDPILIWILVFERESKIIMLKSK